MTASTAFVAGAIFAVACSLLGALSSLGVTMVREILAQHNACRAQEASKMNRVLQEGVQLSQTLAQQPIAAAPGASKITCITDRRS